MGNSNFNLMAKVYMNKLLYILWIHLKGKQVNINKKCMQIQPFLGLLAVCFPNRKQSNHFSVKTFLSNNNSITNSIADPNLK